MVVRLGVCPTVLNTLTCKIWMKLWSEKNSHTKLGSQVLKCCCLLAFEHWTAIGKKMLEWGKSVNTPCYWTFLTINCVGSECLAWINNQPLFPYDMQKAIWLSFPSMDYLLLVLDKINSIGASKIRKLHFCVVLLLLRRHSGIYKNIDKELLCLLFSLPSSSWLIVSPTHIDESQPFIKFQEDKITFTGTHHAFSRYKRDARP